MSGNSESFANERAIAEAPRWRVKPVGVVIGLVLLVAYILPLVFFFGERFDRHTPIVDSTHQIALELKISVADFAKGIVTFQLLPGGGNLLGSNGRLTRDVTIETDPGSGPVTHTFKADTPLTPWVLNASTDSGDILDYPFDRYVIELEMAAKSAGAPVTLATELEDVPHGLKATRTERATEAGQTAINVFVRRTGTIIFVALLSTLSLVLVSAAACSVAWHVAYRGRKIEFSMMIWVAALLFVIPTVRNGLPGSVPTGALVDFLIFFWLQVAAVLAMSSLVYTWIRRGPV